jgi:neutral ceramidase
MRPFNCLSTLLTAAVFLTIAWAAVQTPCAGQSLEVGVARVNLTPPAEMKASLGGYGARASKPALGVHDSVWGKVLVLVRGSRRFCLVTADILAFPPGFKAALIERLAPVGWQADQLMLLASHSHTSIDMMSIHPGNLFDNPRAGLFQRALLDHTATQLAACVADADRKRAPSLLGASTASIEGRNRNRRHGGAIHDADLNVARFDTADGKPLAVLVNWTAHPTFMDEQDMLFSGDWPGHLQRTVEALVGPGVTTLFCNGAEGDQSPVPPADCGSNWERAERYGRDMGILAYRLWDKTVPKIVTTFEVRTEPIPLPRRQAHPDFMKTGGEEYGLTGATVEGFLERLVPAQTHSTCLRLDDLVILGVPGELAASLGIEIKERVKEATQAKVVTIGGLADEWVSYILPVDEYRRGGYEASMSFYGETLGPTVVEAVVRAGQRAK